MNNKGLGKFESLTMVFVIIALLAGGLYLILHMSNNTKYEAMNKSSLGFVDAVKGSDTAFMNYRDYFLAQANDDSLIKPIKNPFGSGECDRYESKVNYDDTEYYVTLKCGDYLMKERKASEAGYKIYKVGEWKDAKSGKDDEMRVAYGCDGCAVEGYYEEAAFVYYYNRVNSTNYDYLNEIKKVETITSKEQYRSLELVYEK